MSIKTLLFAVTAVALAACQGENAQSGTGPDTPPSQPEATPKGTPTGPAVTRTIGPEGGSLASADGVLTLTIPAGAVAAATEFGIQPITNTTPHGLGNAYRLTPEGRNLQKPVDLAFRYSDADLRNTSPDGLGMAYQDRQGVWQAVNAVTVDRTTRSLSVSIDHFSDWSVFERFGLQPFYATVQVNQSINLFVNVCYKVLDSPRPSAPVLISCEKLVFGLVTEDEHFRVNGIEGGNAAVGTVQIDGLTKELIYTAPAQKPTATPVAVSYEFTALSGKQFMLVSNIQVVAADTWAGTITMEVKSSSVAGDGTIRTSAEVAFEFDESTGTYPVTGGSVSVHSVFNTTGREPPCQTTVSGVAPIKPGEGWLVFSDFTSPPQYIVDGYSIFTAKGASTCNDGNKPEEVVDPTGARWAAAIGVKPDGDIIDDMLTSSTSTETITQRIRLRHLTGAAR